MKNKKHSKKYLIIILLIISTSFSCVSTRKYEDALSSVARLKADSTVAAVELATAQYNSSTELLQLRRDVLEQQTKLDSLKTALQKRQAKLNSITSSINEAFPNLNEESLSTNLENGYVHFALDHRVLFNSGEGRLTSDGEMILAKAAKVLKEASSDVMILGHTDSLPFDSPHFDNWMLSIERAHSVAKVLVREGLDPNRLIIAGRSKHDPMFANDHQIGRLLNRRIELILMPDMDKVEDLFADHIEK